ncbi:MAG: ornithine cyclodeaminase family protein, partial [Sphingomonadales bacterium]
MYVIDREEVVRRLDHSTCIGLMRDAMIALSEGRTRQLLRGIIDLGGGDMFGVMPGAVDGSGFGAKLISIFPGAERSHQGVIVMFDRATGAPAGVIDAGEVTAIRTACASAVATDVLARPDAHRLAILGTGEQAWQHAVAIRHVRPVSAVVIWGRASDKAQALAARIETELSLPVQIAASPAEAAAGSDIICTTTGAADPILFSRDIADGTHLNVVGSSRAGPVEIDNALVARSRFFPDHREGVLAQGAEYL